MHQFTEHFPASLLSAHIHECELTRITPLILQVFPLLQQWILKQPIVLADTVSK
jgi:hypothetical protein